MDSTADRLELLQARVAAHEEDSVAMGAERVEVQRLNESVDRLGEVATSLGETLTQLGKDIRELDEKTTADLQRGSRQRIITAVVIVILAVAGVGGGVALRAAQQDEGYSNCVRTQRNAFAVEAYLEAVVKNSTNVELSTTAQNLIDNSTAPPDCQQP